MSKWFDRVLFLYAAVIGVGMCLALGCDPSYRANTGGVTKPVLESPRDTVRVVVCDDKAICLSPSAARRLLWYPLFSDTLRECGPVVIVLRRPEDAPR